MQATAEWARKRIGRIRNSEIRTRVCDNCGQMVPLTIPQCEFCGCEDEYSAQLDPERQWPE